MANPERLDLFVSTEGELEVDAERASAIERGIEDADTGRVITLEEARQPVQRALLNHIDLLKAFPLIGSPVRGSPSVRRLHSPVFIY